MITLELHAEHGRTVVLKRGDPAAPADRSRLGREATMLAIARHPGVVELAGQPDDAATPPAAPSGTGDTTAELRTIFAGARTLATADLDPLAALRALAAVSTTLADLHGLGLVHGRVRADHVVLADSGRAVLCGFGEAGLAGEHRDDGEVLVPSLDVAALGALLSLHLDRSAEMGARRPPIDQGGLSLLATRATEVDTRLRPSARSFAANLDRALPRPEPTAPVGHRCDDSEPSTSGAALGPSVAGENGRLGRHPRPVDRHHGRRRRSRRVMAALGATSALASLGLGLNALTDASGATRPAPRASSVPGNESTSTTESVQTAQSGGTDVQIDGRRFALGTPDDQVLHATWGCGRVDTPVLVRPDGTVFRFGALAEPGREVQGIAAGRLPPRATVEVVHDDHGCAALQALGPDGPVVLPIEPT
jgi:hypothetical protein